MKKKYITPLATEVIIESVNMLAMSLQINNDDKVSSGDQLSNDRRGTWGDLWKK